MEAVVVEGLRGPNAICGPPLTQVTAIVRIMKRMAARWLPGCWSAMETILSSDLIAGLAPPTDKLFDPQLYLVEMLDWVEMLLEPTSLVSSDQWAGLRSDIYFQSVG